MMSIKLRELKGLNEYVNYWFKKRGAKDLRKEAVELLNKAMLKAGQEVKE